MPLDTFDKFALTFLVVAGAAGAYRMYQSVLAERRFRRFLREHNFRKAPPASTMWLARVYEDAYALHSLGEWDGLPVEIRRNHRRSGTSTTIVVTADTELVPASSGNVTIGPWTNPAPPAMLQHGLVASGRELRLGIGDPPDLAAYIAATVAYARALARGAQ